MLLPCRFKMKHAALFPSIVAALWSMAGHCEAYECRCVYPGEMYAFDPITHDAIVKDKKIFAHNHEACQNVEYVCPGVKIDLPAWDYPCGDEYDERQLSQQLRAIKRPLPRHQMKLSKNEDATASAAGSHSGDISAVVVPDSNRLCRNRHQHIADIETQKASPHKEIARIEEKIKDKESTEVQLAEAHAKATAQAGQKSKPTNHKVTKPKPSKESVRNYSSSHAHEKPVMDKTGQSITTVSTARVQSCRPVVLTFDHAADGRPLSGGVVVRNEWAKFGVEITARTRSGNRPHNMRPTILNGSNLKANRKVKLSANELQSLGSPNVACAGDARGGPGVGTGGEPGHPGENCDEKNSGNVLIAYERRPGLRGVGNGHDDEDDFGIVQFSFEPPAAAIYAMELLNVEFPSTDDETPTTVAVLTNDGIEHRVTVEPVGTNGRQIVDLDLLGVQKVKVDFGTVARPAIAKLRLCIDDTLKM